MKTSIKMALAALTLATGMSQANATDFDIILQFNGGLTSVQQEAFVEAEAFWENVITGYAENVLFPPGLTITAVGEYKDGAGGVLGSAGPTSGAYGEAGTLFVRKGQMSFDSTDLATMEASGSLVNVIIHEMAHVIGFGSLWSHPSIDIYDQSSGQYTGQYALAAYRNEFEPNASYVPIELDGGQGTADAHWDESWAGPSSEIMTGFLEGAVTISNTTIQSFRDLGYFVANVANVSNVPALFFGAAPFLLFGFRTRKNKK